MESNEKKTGRQVIQKGLTFVEYFRISIQKVRDHAQHDMLPSLYIKFVHQFIMDSVKTHSQLISGDYRILLNIWHASRCQTKIGNAVCKDESKNEK